MRRAADEQHVVRVERSPKFADRVDGVVLSIGTAWVLMAQETDGGYLDGFIAIRLKDVTRVSRDTSFATTFARSQPDWPPSAPNAVSLDSTEGVLRGMGQGGRLIGIQKERERHAMWAGTLRRIDRRHVYLHEVGDDATRYPVPLGYRLKAITAVEFGSRYFAALSAVAGPGPLVPERTETSRALGGSGVRGTVLRSVGVIRSWTSPPGLCPAPHSSCSSQVSGSPSVDPCRSTNLRVVLIAGAVNIICIVSIGFSLWLWRAPDR